MYVFTLYVCMYVCMYSLIITYDFYHLKVIASNRSAWRNMFLKDERLDFILE